jgi:hypothetical protein
MLKSLKNDRPSYTYTNINNNQFESNDKKNISKNKIKSNFPNNPYHSLPTIYKKVDFEINKEKKIQEFRKKLCNKLIKKYYRRIKFYHKCLRLKYLIRFNKKKLIFEAICKSTIISINMSIQRENKIYDKLVSKYIYQWRKITRLKKVERNFKKDFIVTNGRRFFNRVRNKIHTEVQNEFKKLQYFYSIVSYKFRKLSYLNQNLKKSNQMFYSLGKEKYRRLFVEKILSNFLMKNHFNYLNQIFFRKFFYNKMKLKLQNKFIFLRIKNIFILKTEFKKFRNFMRKSISSKKEENLISLYYQDKIQMKIFQEFKRKLYVKNKFINFVKKYKKIVKNSQTVNLISIYRTLRNDLDYLKEIFRNYRVEKMYHFKFRLFSQLKMKVMLKSKFNLAKEYYKEKSFRKSFNNLHKNYLKRKFFKMFLKKLNQVNSEVIMKQNLKLLKYISLKNKNIINTDHTVSNQNSLSLPSIVENLLIQKFSKKIKNLKILKLKSFFRESKKVLKNKNNLSKKLNVAEYFYHKRLLIKSFSGINIIRSFILVKKKFNFYCEKKFIEMMRNVSSTGENKSKFEKIRKMNYEYIKKKNLLG